MHTQRHAFDIAVSVIGPVEFIIYTEELYAAAETTRWLAPISARTMVNWFCMRSSNKPTNYTENWKGVSRATRIGAHSGDCSWTHIRWSSYDHVTPATRKLHWLPVTLRINFKECPVMYHAVNNRTPQPIADLYWRQPWRSLDVNICVKVLRGTMRCQGPALNSDAALSPTLDRLLGMHCHQSSGRSLVLHLSRTKALKTHLFTIAFMDS